MNSILNCFVIFNIFMEAGLLCKPPSIFSGRPAKAARGRPVKAAQGIDIPLAYNIDIDRLSYRYRS